MHGYWNKQDSPRELWGSLLLLRGPHPAPLFAWTIAKTAVWGVAKLHVKETQLLILKSLPEGQGLVRIFLRNKGLEKCHCWHSYFTLLAQASAHGYNLTKAKGQPRPTPQCSVPGLPKTIGMPSPSALLSGLIEVSHILPSSLLSGIAQTMAIPVPVGEHSPHTGFHLIVCLWWPKGLVILGPTGL